MNSVNYEVHIVLLSSHGRPKAKLEVLRPSERLEVEGLLEVVGF
jgi:hypothetical protein